MPHAFLLQLLDSSCSVSQLDTPLLQQTLSAAAAQQAEQCLSPQLQQQLQQLEQCLQEMSSDALQPLIDALLLPGSTSKAGSAGTAHTTESSTGSHGSSTSLDGQAVGYLLRAAMLPRLQQLRSAAPKSLLLSLVAAGEVYSVHGNVDVVCTPFLLLQLLSSPYHLERCWLPAACRLTHCC